MRGDENEFRVRCVELEGLGDARKGTSVCIRDQWRDDEVPPPDCGVCLEGLVRAYVLLNFLNSSQNAFSLAVFLPRFQLEI